MAREVFSVKIKADLKREFTELVKEKGFSTCFIIETLLRAWLEGFKAAPRGKVDFGPTNVPPVVVNQNFTRVVKRARRKKGGIEEIEVEDKEYLPRPVAGHAWCWNPWICKWYLIDD